MMRNLFLVISVLILVSCGGKKFVKSPVDDIIRDMPTERVFTVVLHDMDVTGTFSHEYFHQYKIIEEVGPSTGSSDSDGLEFELSKHFRNSKMWSTRRRKLLGVLTAASSDVKGHDQQPARIQRPI